METLFIVFIFVVLIIDFLFLDKNDKKALYMYIFLVFLTGFVIITNRYNFLAASPFEMWIERMEPLTNWLKLMLTP